MNPKINQSTHHLTAVTIIQQNIIMKTMIFTHKNQLAPFSHHILAHYRQSHQP